MYDGSEIGIDWRGSLEQLSGILSAKISVATAGGELRAPNGSTRCRLLVEPEFVPGSDDKLMWAVREGTKDVCVKRSKKYTREEAVMQWLAHKSLRAYKLEDHCPNVLDVFSMKGSVWFTMEPIYEAPWLCDYLSDLPNWNVPHVDNGKAILQVVSQIALICLVLEKKIGFNHRDLKTDNILVKEKDIRQHVLRWSSNLEITLAPAPTAVLIDFGFACLGPGELPWLRAGTDVLSELDACPKKGRDIFMLLVFLLWQADVRASLTSAYLDFIKSSLRLTKDRWCKMLQLNRDPANWIYMLITEEGFQCPALDPLTWLTACLTQFPELGSIRFHSAS